MGSESRKIKIQQNQNSSFSLLLHFRRFTGDRRRREDRNKVNVRAAAEQIYDRHRQKKARTSIAEEDRQGEEVK